MTVHKKRNLTDIALSFRGDLISTREAVGEFLQHLEIKNKLSVEDKQAIGSFFESVSIYALDLNVLGDTEKMTELGIILRTECEKAKRSDSPIAADLIGRLSVLAEIVGISVRYNMKCGKQK